MPSRADRRQRAAPGFTGYSGCLPSSTRHSLELGIVAEVIQTYVGKLCLFEKWLEVTPIEVSD